MTTDRVYRKGMPVPQALEEIRKHAGTQFDPTLAERLMGAYGEGRIHDDISTTTPSLSELIDHIR